MSGGGKKSVPSVSTEKTSLQNPITHFKSRAGVYPSNAEVWWAYRRPIELGTQEPPKNYLEVFDPSLRHQITTGNSPAPKGHYILNAFQQDRSSVSGVPGLDVVSAGGARPRAVAFYAGRVFYAGINRTKYNTRIYFSQILERADQVQYCYQSLDPTAEDLRDLLASDGGVLVIPEMTEAYFLHPMGQALYVFARNGVWQISGSQGIGFTANDYSVNKISGVPAISPMSFVDVEGSPIWWNRSGIYTLVPDDSGRITVQSLTEGSIKQFYDTIPSENKEYAKGAYNPLLKRVQWLYRSTEKAVNTDLYKYDRILNLDTNTGAWYPYSPRETTRVEMIGIFDVEGYQIEQVTQYIYADDDEVLVGAEEVYISEQTQRPVQSKFKYIVNVLDDTTDISAPPDVTPIPAKDVYVSSDAVLVGADQVEAVYF